MVAQADVNHVSLYNQKICKQFAFGHQIGALLNQMK